MGRFLIAFVLPEEFIPECRNAACLLAHCHGGVQGEFGAAVVQFARGCEPSSLIAESSESEKK